MRYSPTEPARTVPYSNRRPDPVTAAIIVVVISAMAAIFITDRNGIAVHGSPSRTQVRALLNAVLLVDGRPDIANYDRSCSPGRGCSFGPSWSDATAAPAGHNGCDTRNDVLQVQLRDPQMSTQAPTCKVVAGVLLDPYTGQQRSIAPGETGKVHIDHVYPLSAAWDMGAANWSKEQRTIFANDVELNLLAVSATVNGAKSDLLPGSWMPPEPRLHCKYAEKFLKAAMHYELPITTDDHRELTRATKTCPS